MRLLLVQSPPPPPGDRSVLLPPLGLASLAAVCRRTGHQVSLLDAPAQGLPADRLAARVPRGYFDLIGLSGTSPGATGLVAMARAVAGRSHWLVAGGPHATAAPVELFAAAPELDLIVRGEAEEVLPELLAVLAAGDLPGAEIPGVARPEAPGRVRPPVQELDRLPWPARDLLPRDGYRHPLARRRPLATLLSSRGCAHHCLFCDRSVSGHRWRGRAAEAVVEELLALSADGYGEVLVYDDDFLHDEVRAGAIAEGLARAGAPLPWSCEARPQRRDPGLYEALVAAGCRRIAFGVEAGTAAGLAELNKDLDLDEVAEAFAAARRAGLETVGYFLVGLAAEPPGQDAALRRALELQPDYAQFSSLAPYPGSALYRQAGAAGTLATAPAARGPADLGGARPYVAAGGWDARRLAVELGRAYRAFYGRPGYLVRRLARLDSGVQLAALARGAASLATWSLRRTG